MRCAPLLLLIACGHRETAAPPPGAPEDRTTRTASPPGAPETRTTTDPASSACPVEHASLGAGLDVERWPIAATPAAGGPACVDVVRADPARFALRVLSAATDDARTAPDWRDAFHLAAVTNAGMFHSTGQPVGLIVGEGAARGSDNKKMSGFLAWDPIAPSDPPAMIAGRDCPGFDLAALRARYRSIIQSYRLLGCDGGALPWQDPKHYSAAAIAVDHAGRIVFLHARAAVTMAELSTALAAHDLSGALFLEGGPEASLVARGETAELARVGSYETGFVENDGNTAFWNLPNVVGVFPR